VKRNDRELEHFGLWEEGQYFWLKIGGKSCLSESAEVRENVRRLREVASRGER